VPRTDEERVQSFPHVLDHFKGMSVVATLKHDGTSATYFWDSELNKIRVCSRNMEKMYPDESVYWQVLKTQPDIERLCRENPMMVFQGEITGPGIQKNPMGRKAPVFTLFNAFDRDGGDYIPHYYAKFLLDGYDVPWVETVYEWSDFDATLEELLELAKGFYPGTKNHREGIVLRPFMEEKYVYVLGGRLSCKVINNDFLEKGGE
jgi:RNA ligase (TIGR02306 family)